MDQHVISAWYLRAFARRVGGSAILHVYDKQEDSFAEVSVDKFLTETDVHSADIERRIGSLEAPASDAARRLAKRVKTLPPGLYAFVEPGEPIISSGPGLFVGGEAEEMKLLVTRYQIPAPSGKDLAALAAYAGLMYWRAPKVQAGTVVMREVYDRAAQGAVDALMPGMRIDTISEINQRRSRMIRNAEEIGRRLAASNWWALRARDDRPFVLGDNPVGTTISLGHDDSWRAIFAGETYVVAMPLGPTTALILAPQHLLPVTGIADPSDAGPAVNRLIWRSADRFVVAKRRADLDGTLRDLGSARAATIPVDIDLAHVARKATADSTRIVAEVLFRRDFGTWRRWSDCRLELGYRPIASEDRDIVYGPPDH